MSDETMRVFASNLPVPEFATTAWTVPPPLADATVAIVTTAALHPVGTEGWGGAATGFRELDAAERHLVLGHWSPNFDRAAIAADLNVAYPVDRLDDLVEQGVIKAVGPRNIAFAGNQEDTVSVIRYDTGPKAAELLRSDGVDVVLLTPV